MIEGYQNIKNKKFIYNEYYIIHDDIIIFFSYSNNNFEFIFID